MPKPDKAGRLPARAESPAEALERAVVERLGEDFVRHGDDVFEALRTKDPKGYFAVVTRLLPGTGKAAGERPTVRNDIDLGDADG